MKLFNLSLPIKLFAICIVILLITGATIFLFSREESPAISTPPPSSTPTPIHTQDTTIPTPTPTSAPLTRIALKPTPSMPIQPIPQHTSQTTTSHTSKTTKKPGPTLTPKKTVTPTPPNTPAATPTPTPSVNIADFGAIPDDEIDDTEAIQNAVNAGINQVVYLPSGTYILNSRVEVNGPITIVGDENTVLRTTSEYNLPITILDTSDVHLENFTILGPSSTHPSYGVFMANVSNITIDKVLFSTLGENAVDIRGGENISITNSTFEDLLYSGIRISSYENQNNHYITIAYNEFRNVSIGQNAGHGAIATHENFSEKIKFITIEDNYVESNGIGFALDTLFDSVVRNNRLIGTNIMGEGIAFSGSRNIIENNTINEFYAGCILDWVQSGITNDSNTIIGNTLYDCSQGIAVSASSGNPSLSNLTIESNRIYDTPLVGRDQQFGIQWYLNDEWSTFTSTGVNIISNDLRGNSHGPWNFADLVDPYFEGNIY